jgi:hypothetical protein
MGKFDGRKCGKIKWLLFKRCENIKWIQLDQLESTGEFLYMMFVGWKETNDILTRLNILQ